MRGADFMEEYYKKGFWLFLTAAVTIALSLFGYMAGQMNHIATSVGELNKNMAVVLAQGEARDMMLQDHEQRIRKVERQD